MLQNTDSGGEHWNHAKIATVKPASVPKVLPRRSINLTAKRQFEPVDITEDGPGFDQMKHVDNELPTLDNDCSGREVYEATELDSLCRPYECAGSWSNSKAEFLHWEIWSSAAR
jgi:hypothetical protein